MLFAQRGANLTQAWSEIVITMRPQLVRRARKAGRRIPGQDPEDAVQETYVVLVDKCKKFVYRNDLQTQAFVSKVFDRVLSGQLRNQSTAEIPVDQIEKYSSRGGGDVLEVETIIELAFRLPEHRRAIVHFKFVLGLDSNEIAAIYGKTERWVTGEFNAAITQMANWHQQAEQE